jgi:hypothetical protein
MVVPQREVPQWWSPKGGPTWEPPSWVHQGVSPKVLPQGVSTKGGTLRGFIQGGLQVGSHRRSLWWVPQMVFPEWVASGTVDWVPVWCTLHGFRERVSP